MKRIVHTYKGRGQWSKSPPGIGDFVRGTCHLFERLEGSSTELRVDLSQTEFAPLIEQDPTFFQTSEPAKIANAEEWFLATEDVGGRIDRFLQSTETELYLCTNLGAWNRPKLPRRTREFMEKFYRFTAPVTDATAGFVSGEYAALSVRCGDKFYGQEDEAADPALNARLFQLVEKEILPRLGRLPLVVMSDCYPLKRELVRRYGCLTSPHISQHGAFGNVLPVAVDLNVLKHSQRNYHINAWQSWWSGFSHYTSLVFGISSVNFRTPDFVREEVTRAGILRRPVGVEVREKWRKIRSFARQIARGGVVERRPPS